MLIWLRGLVRRRPLRLLATAAGVALTAALLASLGAFLSAAQSTMTVRSIQRVPVDWQIEVTRDGDPGAVTQAAQQDSGIITARPVGYATVAGFESDAAETGDGEVVGLPPDYTTAFPGELRPLAGAASGVLLAQPAAAALRAKPGESITLRRADHPDVTMKIDGVVELPEAATFLQTVGAPDRQPPADVLLMPGQRFTQLFGTDVRWQFHVRLAHDLDPDPATAYDQVTDRARAFEARTAGGALVGDNLGGALDSAREDAEYATALFLFLGLPGAALAVLLTASIAAAGRQRRRAEQALLRARGAGLGALVRLALAEALAVGALGAAAGLGLAAPLDRYVVGAGLPAAWAVAAGAVAAGTGVVAMVLPAVRDARSVTVVAARRSVGGQPAPRWLRYGLDLWLLAGSAAVFLVTGRSGYRLVTAAQGVPHVSVGYWAFAGPALLWAGAGLLIWRLTRHLAGSRSLLRGLARPVARGLAGTVAATIARRRSAVGRTVAIAALAVVFAVSTATFAATYRQQALADAKLTNGADVTVSHAPGADERSIRSIQGVRTVEPLQHRVAYVGADLKDLYGVRPSTLLDTTRLDDDYFDGDDAREVIGRLAASPDAILASKATVADYQLHMGEELRLRIGDGPPITFRFAGVVEEFPTATREGFLVANASYIASKTGSGTVDTYLVTTDGTAPHEVAARLRSALGPQAHLSDLDTTRRVLGSSLTAVDLTGLTGIELSCALLLAVAATGLLLALGFAERRRTLALAAVLGARGRQLGGFVWTEVALVGLGTAAFGALTGWALSRMLVTVLGGVFDPPPSHLAIPWAYLGILAAIAVLALAAAGLLAVRVARRPPLGVLRDL
ncbi:ABC transporter permease [Nonomuraea sp. NPDC050536]|uniref:ABC transporter permease n=1 Tax=Nonomuraea sp. NPDC050536 TaxID=3364366 RepID=UPI0037CB3326